MVHLRPFNTIRSKLVYSKDKVHKNERAGMVYKIKCSDCDKEYIGGTERCLKKCLTEHHRITSPVGHHIDYNKHSFQQSEVSILHQEMGWFRRGAAESFHICKKKPALN